MPFVVDRSIVSFDSGGRLTDAPGEPGADAGASDSALLALAAADGLPEAPPPAWHPAKRIATNGASSFPFVTGES
jgi:hypothetical protein